MRLFNHFGKLFLILSKKVNTHTLWLESFPADLQPEQGRALQKSQSRLLIGTVIIVLYK